MPDYRALARQEAVDARINPDAYERQIDTESQFNPNAFNTASGATGIAQIIPSLHPGVDPRDPAASLRYAAQWMRQLLNLWQDSYVRALSCYNWGPGNVSHWDGRRETLPSETCRYLDKILGPGWPNPDDPLGPLPAGMRRYIVANTDHAGLNLRQAPRSDAPVVGRLVEGTILEAADRAWRNVRDLADDQVGWAAAQFLAEAAGKVRVANTDHAGLNLREGPETTAAALKVLPEGSVVEPLDRAWRQVRVAAARDQQGWAADQFLAVA